MEDGGAHEISGIKAPLFLCGCVVGGFLGWVGGGRVGGGVEGGKRWGWVVRWVRVGGGVVRWVGRWWWH